MLNYPKNKHVALRELLCANLTRGMAERMLREAVEQPDDAPAEAEEAAELPRRSASASSERAGRAPPATCTTRSCTRESWNGMAGACCRTCDNTGGAAHGPKCDEKHRQVGDEAEGHAVGAAATGRDVKSMPIRRFSRDSRANSDGEPPSAAGTADEQPPDRHSLNLVASSASADGDTSILSMSSVDASVAGKPSSKPKHKRFLSLRMDKDVRPEDDPLALEVRP